MFLSALSPFLPIFSTISDQPLFVFNHRFPSSSTKFQIFIHPAQHAGLVFIFRAFQTAWVFLSHSWNRQLWQSGPTILNYCFGMLLSTFLVPASASAFFLIHKTDGPIQISYLSCCLLSEPFHFQNYCSFRTIFKLALLSLVCTPIVSMPLLGWILLTLIGCQNLKSQTFIRLKVWQIGHKPIVNIWSRLF